MVAQTLLALSLSVLASQSYQLKHVPNDAGGGCSAVAEAVKPQFAAAAKVQVTSARGTQDATDDTCTVTLFYQAAHPIDAESTEPDPVQPGTYASLEECQRDLATQRQLFETYTRVPAAFAYCYKQSVLIDAGLSDSPIGLHIEGYGKGAEHYKLQSIDVQTPLAAGDTSPEGVAAALTAQGFHLAQVRTRYEAGVVGAIAPTLQIGYYTAREAPFDFVVAWNGSDETCAENLVHVSDLLHAAGVAPFLAYCSGMSGASYAGMFVHYIDNGKVTVKDGPQGYASEAACQADADRVVQSLQAQGGWHPLGGVCSIGWHGVEMQVIGTKI